MLWVWGGNRESAREIRARLRECENSGKETDRDALGELSSRNSRLLSKAYLQLKFDTQGQLADHDNGQLSCYSAPVIHQFPGSGFFDSELLFLP